ncbi:MULTISPECIES: O-antigen ligase family protein [Sphingobacterium]|uniref:O-antigen ligase family protein n=1 Tax=Sphingobacterium TaxID=28453 RepID=UPI0010470E3B|nr:MULTISPECIES: O-antigen ligase family protein [Sphingobacterium]MCW2261024.1 O-antigen ligase [Sphingobacterium kitahiroshimense]TCR08340.1 O-antigen ligase [Sphingobacterium sp. JUb78]
MKILSLLLFIVLALAFINNPMLSHWKDEPRVYYFFFASVFFSLPLLLLEFNDQQKKINLIDLAVLSVFLLLFIYSLSKVLFHKTDFDDFLLSITSIWIMYFPFKYLIKKDHYSVIRLFILIFYLQVFIGIGQFLYALVNDLNISLFITGSFRHSGIFAIYLASFFPVKASVLNIDTRLKLIWSVVVLFLILLTQSRTGVFLYLCSITFIFWPHIKMLYEKSRYKLAFILIPTILTFLLASILVYFKLPSAKGRLFIWQNSFDMILQKPILGWGYNGFEKFYLSQQANFFKSSNLVNSYSIVADSVSTPLNEYINLLVEFGFLGAAVLLLIVIISFLFFKVFDAKKVYSYFLFILLFLSSAFFYFTFKSTGLILLILLAISYISCEYDDSKDSTFLFIIEGKTLVVIKCCLFIFLSLMFYFTYKQYSATVKWRMAINYIPTNSELSFKMYDRIYKDLEHRPAFLYNYGAELFQDAKFSESTAVFTTLRARFITLDGMVYLGKSYKEMGNFNLAEKTFKEASFMVPNRFIPKYQLFKLYCDTDKILEAYSIAEEILNMPIKISSIEIDNIKKEVKSFLINKQFFKSKF